MLDCNSYSARVPLYIETATPIRVVSFIRACCCSASGLNTAVSSIRFPSLKALLHRLDQRWKKHFTGHRQLQFVYSFAGYQINSVAALKNGETYICVSLPLSKTTFDYLWQRFATISCEDEADDYADYAGDVEEDSGLGVDVLHYYRIGRQLGQGKFGNVYQATDKSTGRSVAIKLICDSSVNDKTAHGKIEAELMSISRHDNVVELLALIETPTQWCLVLELFHNGDLFSHIENRGPMAESVVKPLAKDLAAAVKHLHSLSIVHRDIKLENAYLVTRYDGRLSLKIGDFGEAVCATEPLYEFTGTKLYMAPELWLKIGYGLKVDLWAMGITVFAMLAGYLPFHADNDNEMMHLILNGRIDFCRLEWTCLGINSLAVEFIECLLRTDPFQRPSALNVFHHPWLDPEKKS